MQKRLFSLLSIIVVACLWEAAVKCFSLSPLILPSPTRILAELWSSLGYLSRHSAVTGAEAVTGFIIGFVIAFIFGVPIALSRTINALFTPHIIISQVIPKAALAPLLIIWFGYGMPSKIVVAAAISFFPIFTALVQGLTSPSPELIELFDGFAATKAEVLLKLRFPVAIPYIMASLQLAALYALLGAITAEFVNADKGLGYVLVESENNLNTPLLFAAIVCAGLLGLIAWSITSAALNIAQRRFRLHLNNESASTN
jgi:NitT/TauT family transport system permease protein